MTHEKVMEQVREKIARVLQAIPDHYGLSQADEILSIPEILIKDPDQTLDNFLKIVGKRYPEFLDVITKEHWVKVLPKVK